jgi:pyruvate dehydrogenase E2 component (dihydrolipoamide acetyltransferase)
MGDFCMPALGADLEYATLAEWLVKPGDSVKHGDIIAIVETHKGAFEVEVFEDGVVETLLVPAGTNVPVGGTLARIRSAVAAAPSAAPAVSTPLPPAAPLPTAAPVPHPAGRHVRASPVARKRAADLGVDLEHVVGTGPSGAIVRADVERAAAAPDHAAGMRVAIAAAVSRSKREIPHYYLSTRIDLRRALAWLERENLQRSMADRLLPAVLLLKAVALALHEVPELNGFWRDGRFQPSADIHVGVAVSLRGGGLMAPAIHHTDQKSLVDLMGALRDLVQRTRSGRLRGSEMTDPTITLTNLGDRGVESVFGIIYPPQVAIVGFGRIAEQPWAENGLLGVRPVVTATLAADHRVTDGHRGAQFLSVVDRLLQTPEDL